ncbi:MAG TPA: TonB-dependent receptor [Cellvibrionaceae bacterium]
MALRKVVPRAHLAAAVGALVGIQALFLPQTACAEDYLDLSPEQLLDTQVLSVSKKIETVAQAPAAIFVVTSEEIARSGVTNIPDALRMVPGVNVARLDSNSWAISIRGFNSPLANKLLVLIDGRSIYNPVFGGVLWEAHNLMLADIDRIEVIRGPGGALWGANAVNGVINIITKPSQDTQNTTLNALAGNEESSMSGRYGGNFGEEGTYRVYAKAFEGDNSHAPLGGEAYDAWRGMRTGFRADWGAQGEAESFTVQGDAYQTSAEQRRVHYSLIEPFEPVANQTIRYDGINLLGRWIDRNSDGGQLSIQTYLDWTRRNEPFNFIDDRITYDFETQYNFAPSRLNEWAAGAGFRFMADDEIGDNNVVFSPKQRRNSLYNLFVQDKITLAPEHWFLTLGSKFEHNEFSGFEVQPNLRLQWQPSKSQTLWSSVSRAVRTPTPIEEDLTSTLRTAKGFRAAFVPNDEFQSEQLTAYELGYRNQLTALLAVDVAAFHNIYEHLQTYTFQSFEPVVNGVDPPHILLPVKFTNNMHGDSHGFEASVNWAVQENLKIALDYSYLSLAVTAVDRTQESAELLFPKEQKGIKVYWNVANSWTLDTTISHVGKLPGGQVQAYTRVDINLGGKLGKNLRANLVGQNLLEKTHREFGSVVDNNAAEIERSVFAKLTWTF